MSAQSAPHAPRRTWWRRNWIGLVALAILAPATIAYTFSNEWGAYYSERPSQPVQLAAGEAAEFGGATWQLESAVRFGSSSAEGEAAELPDGTDLVVVQIGVQPGEPDAAGLAPGCDVKLDALSAPLSDGGAVLRSWGDAGFDALDYDFDPALATYCDTEVTAPYVMEQIFLVPSGTGDDFALQLETISELPRFLHLAIEPLPAS